MKNSVLRHPFFGTIAAIACALLLHASVAAADPPSRVARLAVADGAVSFSPAGDDDWVRASVNRPLVTGDRLWADTNARVEIQMGGATARMGAMTNVTLANLDDRMQQFQLTEGTLQLRVRGLAAGEQIEIDTPNFAFVTTRPGAYRFDVDPNEGTTTLLVRSGEGDVYGDGAAYRISSGQGARFRGSDLRDSDALGLAPPDPFERWAQSRDARYDRLVTARYVAPEVVGYEDLDAYGTWRVVANVGNVWTPREVPAGWAPYRTGHWAWVDPWGWTWVDDAPWGFAPFHYGRWTVIDDRWCWVPGPVRARPVYAPALVAFVGGANFSLSVSSGPAIGWFPLAPGEVYRPAYAVSRDYFTRVNVTNTTVNTTYVTNIYETRDRVTDVRYANFARPAAITAVPPSVFTQAQSVQRASVAVDRQVLDKAEVVPLAKVAPERKSVTGDAPAARAAPAAARERHVLAKAPPPPPPAPSAARLPAARTDPGRPAERPAPGVAGGAPTSPAAAAPVTPPVRVVKDGGEPKPLPPQAMRERRGGAEASSDATAPSSRDERRASRTAVPPAAAPPPSTTAPPAAGATRPPSAAAPPAAAPTPPPSATPPSAAAAPPFDANARDRVKGPPARDERATPPSTQRESRPPTSLPPTNVQTPPSPAAAPAAPGQRERAPEPRAPEERMSGAPKNEPRSRTENGRAARAPAPSPQNEPTAQKPEARAPPPPAQQMPNAQQPERVREQGRRKDDDKREKGEEEKNK